MCLRGIYKLDMRKAPEMPGHKGRAEMDEKMDEQLTVKYIRTKSKVRKIVTYKEQDGELRRYHEEVAKFLNKNVKQSVFAKAYTPRSSIYKNARAHMYNDIFLKMDIKNFFPNINHKYLAECMYFEINKNKKISRKECYDIVGKCSVSDKGLPLGLVSSPVLANLYMKEFDGLLYGQIKKMDLGNPIYTRYADDMVISFRWTPDYEQKIEHLIIEVKRLLERVHMTLNDKKTAVYNLLLSNHVRITGVSITKDENNYRHISVGRRLKNDIFWRAVGLYEQEAKDYAEVERIKGMYSFLMSIEKRGIEDCYSERMKEIIREKGYENLEKMIRDLGEEHENSSTHG